MLTKDLAGQISRRIELALTANNFELAHSILTEAERTSTSVPEVVSLDDHIVCLNCSARITNALERAGFTTIREVLNSSRDRPLEIDGINTSSLAEIMAAARLLVDAG